MADLKTVPSFIFHQGRPDGGDFYETPISVAYYAGSIELEQGEERILIHPKFFDALVKEISKHRKDAEMASKRKN